MVESEGLMDIGGGEWRGDGHCGETVEVMDIVETLDGVMDINGEWWGDVDISG